MDCVHLVKSGKYNAEEIKSEASKEFIRGIEYARERIDGFFDDGDTYDEFSETLGAIKKEIITSAVEYIKELLEILKCEDIVSILDREATEEEGSEG